jgi:putative transposase
LVQIDHTQLDVMVVDESQRLVLGRPWLAIDVASRVVTGFYVSLDARAAISVAMVLTHGVLPKDLWLADRQLDLSWPVAGVPESLHLDNAPEFDSEAWVRGTQEYGIALEHRPPKQPHFGGHIERLIFPKRFSVRRGRPCMTGKQPPPDPKTIVDYYFLAEEEPPVTGEFDFRPSV